MLKKMINRVENFIVYFFTLFMILVVTSVISLHYHVDFVKKKEFLIHDLGCLVIGLSVIGIASFLLYKVHLKNTRKRYIALFFILLILFIVQIVSLYYYYFFPGWDSGIVIRTGYRFVYPEQTNYVILKNYFSYYPNNILITMMIMQFFKILKFFIGDFPLSTGIYGLVVLQAVLSNITAYLLYQIVYHYSESRKAGLFSITFYAILISLSPWISIPYSDVLGLIFPISILRLYQKQEQSRFPYLYWVLIGLITFIGYKIKPQVIFMSCAIIVIEFLYLLKNKKIKRYLISMGLFVFGIFTFWMVNQKLIMPRFPVPLFPEKEFSYTHFLMMGLNVDTGGTYSTNDLVRSAHEPTKEAREKMNKKVIKERLKELGVTGVMTHYFKKNLTNYSDGTFAWGLEGHFIRKQFPFDENPHTYKLLRNIYDPKGQYYPIVMLIEQIAWITLLFCMCGVGLVIFYKKIKKEILVSILTILALTLFETLFEARARYFISTIPIYIFLGTIGWMYLYHFVTGRKLNHEHEKIS